jgi:DNA-3-methyladenine glycosylase II
MAKKRQGSEAWAEAVSHLKSKEPRLVALIDKVGPCGLRPKDDLLATLANSIIAQQISAKAAQSIFSKVTAAMSSPWKPEELNRLDEEFLKSCGVSPQKRGYLASLVEHVRSGRLHLAEMRKLDDEAVIAELTQVKGIGRWTAEMFLIFALNRPDVLPMADLGIKSGLLRLYELDEHPSPEAGEELTRHWRPYRSIGSWYLWRMFD